MENKRDDEMFPGPTFLRLGGHQVTPSLREEAANAIMLLTSPVYNPPPVSQDSIVVPYKLIDSSPLMVTLVTPEEVVRAVNTHQATDEAVTPGPSLDCECYQLSAPLSVSHEWP